jgi:hypothetical protein
MSKTKLEFTAYPDLSSERAPYRDNTATFRQKISVHKFQSELDTKTDCQS